MAGIFLLSMISRKAKKPAAVVKSTYKKRGKGKGRSGKAKSGSTARVKTKAAAQAQAGQTCPQCGQGELTLKAGKFGKFLGCSRYAAGCHYTENIERKTSKKRSKRK